MHRHIPERWDCEDAWYFVTIVTRDRYPYFASSKQCKTFLAACRSVKAIHPFRMGALVLMPDHWHALIKPKDAEVIESVVGNMKKRTYHASHQNGSAISWQSRFLDHRIRDEADYFRHLEYMRVNPAKHERVKNDTDPWPWWFVHQNPFG